MDSNLERIAKELGISKKDILAMSETDLEQKVSEKDGPGAKISLEERDDREDEERQAEENAAVLENISSKQEIDLNQKVDDRHTLAEIMGVPAGSKLVTVYSNSIANNKNTTRFSHLISTPDGKVQEADMLKQVGGKTSDKTIYESNRDGSEIEKMNVQSTYSIDSPIAKNAIITAKIGSMGYIEVGYGQTDRTSHKDAFTHELETERTRYTTREVREEFRLENGMDNVPEKMDEIKKYEEYGCNNHDLSLDQADGNPATGAHLHEETLEQIKAYDSDIGNVFTDREIEERFQKMAANYPDDSIEEVVNRTQKDLSEDASRMRMH